MKLLKTLFKLALFIVAGFIVLTFLVVTFGHKQTPQERAAAGQKAYAEQQAELRAREAQEAKAKADKIEHADLEAFTTAQEIVTRRLKAPATAKFASREDSRVDQMEPGQYRVTSWVDSQNGFGAMLRMHFTVDLKTTDGEHFQVLKVASR